jgi:hypothetical protein
VARAEVRVERVIELAKREQTSVRRDRTASELEAGTGVNIEQKRG